MLWKSATETAAWKTLTAISCRVCFPSTRIRFVSPSGDDGPGPTFSPALFIVAVPIGIAAIIVGALASIQAIGTGLMFGGIFTVMDGYCWYWSELQDWMRFLSLLAAFVVLIFIGYRKLAK